MFIYFKGTKDIFGINLKEQGISLHGNFDKKLKGTIDPFHKWLPI